jgi:rhodanese-related sulfurtransferase
VKKTLAALALVGAIVLAGCGSSSGGGTTVDAATWITEASQPGVTVIDVRTPAEFAAGHVEGAVNIDVESPAFAAEIAKLDKSQPYSLYCRSGNRSAVAMDQMTEAGFTDITNLDGGLVDLADAGAPVVQS